MRHFNAFDLSSHIAKQLNSGC